MTNLSKAWQEVQCITGMGRKKDISLSGQAKVGQEALIYLPGSSYVHKEVPSHAREHWWGEQ